MKLWAKNTDVQKEVEQFTVGNDRELDMYLAPFDVLGSLAHITMLQSIDLLSKEELELLKKELVKIYGEIERSEFKIEEGVEDVHSQVEYLLTQRIGEAGKKIHSGRSRNDQVLVDIKQFLRYELKQIVGSTKQLFDTLQSLSEEHKDKLLPGYTHLQIAMPSSFGLWFGAYAESLMDDMEFLLAAYKVANKNPLGSAAGYGSSFPLNRTMTTELLGFGALNHNVVYAQMTRGKTEKLVAMALASVAATLSKFAYDVCLYINQNFGFISFPDHLTTGSSIMPHKKNPDVFELIRAKCNKLQALPNDLTLLTNNLPSGYFRDMQVTKAVIVPAFQELEDCLQICNYMLQHITCKDGILKDEKYKYLFSVEVVNNQVLEGVPFREAYKNVGLAIEAENFKIPESIHHTHEGSIGNLCTAQIKAEMEKVIKEFDFEKVEKAIENLLK
ncbi:argininosuccinate lyase [Solitalea koreensis]|uniref:Argininosuccinate lyase n=1 Tax=Solitalea koreensis TaxID=543615 RepID=A0A521C9K2_9SPHI|nr:argininosuccinate lyase [Solitalea koreensis]SMO56093.1 argininosuccinate lyase [Solitalea koreensis]